MKRLSLTLLLLLPLLACNRGWTQGDRDKLVNTCVEKAQSQGIDPNKLKNYCACYQQNIEKKYATMGALTKADANSISAAAQECLPLMVQ